MARWHLNLAQLRAQTPLFQRSAVAVGNFDGVHKGHASILRLAVERAAAAGETPIALTFDPHPRAVVGLGAPEALTTGDERDRIILGLGIEAVVTLRFDADVAGLPPETFVREVLLDGLGARRVVVGDNFRFGRGARGTTDLLEQLGRELGFSVQVAPTVRSDDGRVVSSTLVRELIRAGDVAAAARLLQRRYCLSGQAVGVDAHRSADEPHLIVTPEARMLLPAAGVYDVLVYVEGAELDPLSSEAVVVHGDGDERGSIAIRWPNTVETTFGRLVRIQFVTRRH